MAEELARKEKVRIVSTCNSAIYCTVGTHTTPQIFVCSSLLRCSPSVNRRMVTCVRVWSD